MSIDPGPYGHNTAASVSLEGTLTFTVNGPLGLGEGRFLNDGQDRSASLSFGTCYDQRCKDFVFFLIPTIQRMSVKRKEKSMDNCRVAPTLFKGIMRHGE